MPSRTTATTFGELVARGILEIGDGYRAKLNELGGDGPIFLRAGLLSERGLDWDSGERFYKDRISKLGSKLGRPGDTLVTTKGNSVGRTGYVPADAPSFVYSPHLSYWRSLDLHRLSSRFLYYWSRSRKFLTQLQAMAYSTDMAPYLSLTDQRRLRIELPGISVQDAVADILGALDDKIAVNDLIERATYQLAQALFSNSAKHASRMIVLRDIIDLRYGRALPEGVRESGTVPVFGSNGRSGWHSKPLNPGPGIIVGRKGANAGSVTWSQSPFWVIDTAFFVDTIQEDAPLEYLYFLLQQVGFRSQVGDSAIPGLNREIALACTAMLPSEEVIRTVASEVRQLLELRAHMSHESAKLAELRDSLLPKLMSGEIRVRETERIVEDAT